MYRGAAPTPAAPRSPVADTGPAGPEASCPRRLRVRSYLRTLGSLEFTEWPPTGPLSSPPSLCLPLPVAGRHGGLPRTLNPLGLLPATGR